MKYMGKVYKVHYFRLSLLLSLTILTIFMFLFVAKTIIGFTQEQPKIAMAILTKDTISKTDLRCPAADLVDKFFPKGKKPPLQEPTDRKLIALTFDDGPGSESTAKILDCLKEHDIKATFFVLGLEVEKKPDMVKRIYDEGHEIGSHSYSHANLTSIDDNELLQQVNSTNKLTKDITKEDIKYLRPPYGAYNDNVANKSKLHIVLWNVDSTDWKHREKDTIVNTVLEQLKPRNIILFHDIYDSTADAIIELIPKLKEQGYEFVTISEYIEITELTIRKSSNTDQV